MQVVREAGIETERGVVVDDRMQTSAENVYAIGECAEHDGIVQGVVSPGLEQARVVLNRILEEDSEDRYRASVISTSLKVMGIDLISAVDVYDAESGCEAIVSSNPIEGRYRKAVVRDGTTIGAVLFGDITGGGVTSPDELRRIANVAEKYNARMVKITGAQRLDILDVKKEDLPKAWADLDMPSGHAYTKALRQVKTCVGTDFCRFGVGDSTSLGIEIEEAPENLYTPAKVKLGASGCPRNCAESSVKDIGLIAIEGGWQIYVGGAAGMDVRKGDVIATVETPEEARRVGSAFFQYYRENAEFGERTYDFVPRIGLEELRREILDDETADRLI